MPSMLEILLLGALLLATLIVGNALNNKLSAPLERSAFWRRYFA